MKHIVQIRPKAGKIPLLVLLVLVVIHIALAACATAPDLKKGSGVVPSQEATDIWHSYEILPNYNYYASGPESQPNYIIGIDNKYRLNSKLWRPVDLKPELLKKWFNFVRPRVGYDPQTYGAFITGPNGERVGLWYSVRDWRLMGSARVGEENTISVRLPPEPGGARGTTRRNKYY